MLLIASSYFSIDTERRNWLELYHKGVKDIFKRPKLTPITLKFDPLVLEKIKMLARKRGISYNAYIRYLVAKSVEKEMLPANR